MLNINLEQSACEICHGWMDGLAGGETEGGEGIFVVVSFVSVGSSLLPLVERCSMTSVLFFYFLFFADCHILTVFTLSSCHDPL